MHMHTGFSIYASDKIEYTQYRDCVKCYDEQRSGKEGNHPPQTPTPHPFFPGKHTVQKFHRCTRVHTRTCTLVYMYSPVFPDRFMIVDLNLN